MKRTALLAIALVALVGAFIVLAPGLVSIEVVRRSIAYEIAGWSGRALAFEGTPTVAFTPYLTVTFPNVSIQSSRAPDTLVAMESLSAQIPLLPLIFAGRIEPTAFDFRKPVFNLSVDAGGNANWTFPDGLDETSRVQRLDVSDGSIHYRGVGGRSLELKDIDASFRWPNPAGSASLQGKANWRGETVDLSGTIGSLHDFIAGAATPLQLFVVSTPLQAAFSGDVRQIDGLTATGELSMATPSLRGLAGLFGESLGEGNIFGAAKLKSTLSLTRGMVMLADAALTLDGNAGEGALSADLGAARPAFQGTLAFDDLDVSTYLAAAEDALDVARSAPDSPLGWSRLDQFDLDFRLSADKVSFGDRALGHMAGSAALRDGRLDVAIGEMQLYGGRLTASLSAETRGEVPSAALRARLDAVPLGKAIADFSARSTLDGTARATLDIAARGQSWNELILSLSGGGSAALTDGTLQGINLSALQGRTVDAIALGSALLGGSTPFSQATCDFSIAGSTLSIQEATIEGPAYWADLSGSASLADKGLALRGEIRTEASSTIAEREVPFLVGGTWPDPSFQPDLRGF